MHAGDSAARRLALSPDRSFIVQAPAGSGKTELLIQRCLKLLATVERPESVVAITFTIKAAAEMRRRLITALESADGPAPEAAHKRLTWELARAVRERDRALGWDISGNPHRLEVRTIDSLCASIVRRMPWLSRMGPPPEIVEEPDELYAEAARHTVALVEDDRYTDAVACLLRHLDNDAPVLREMIARMLARRDQWLRHIGAGPIPDPGAVRRMLEHSLENAVLDVLETALDAAPACVLRELPSLASYAASNLEPDCGSPILDCLGMRQFPSADVEDLPAWKGIAELVLTGKGQPRKAVDKNLGFPAGSHRKREMRSILEVLPGAPAFCEALGRVRALPEPRYTDAQWDVVEALLTVLPVAAAQLHAVFQTRGQIDFTEVLLAAGHALGPEDAPTDLGLAFDYRIEHLLVDEFQDTSVSQWKLLERLTAGWTPGDGRTLFLVGDPMQSIYRFREAEVSLFLRAAQGGLGTVALEPIQLTVNFRSQSGIVEWINNTFSEILPHEHDPSSGAVAFSASVADRPAGPEPAVAVHPFVGEAPHEEAAKVVELVRNAQGSTAILVRARSHLPAILWALRDQGIPYRAVDIDSLRDLPVIQDLLALTCAMLHPADRISWLAILRAPWCGLTLAELHRLVAGAPHAVVPELLNDEDRVAALGPAAAKSVRRLRDAVRRSLARPGRAVRDRVEGAWVAAGGPACLHGSHDLENARAYFELLEGIDEGGGIDLDTLRERVTALYAAPDPAADGSLQVLTIHKAKGLEFDTVIVPHLGHQTRGVEPRLLVWEELPAWSREPGGSLLLAPVKAAAQDSDALYKFVQGFDIRKTKHETARLLYVACTRAREQLHVLGSAAAGRDGLKPKASSFLACLWKTVAPAWAGLPEQQPAPVEVREHVPPPQILRRLPSLWDPPEPPAGVVLPAGPEAEDVPDPEPAFDWVRNTLRRVGTVVHAVLLEIAREGSPAWDAARVKALRPRIEAALSGLGVGPAELPAAAAKAEEALTRTLEDKRGRQILGTHWAEAANEVALTGVLDGRLVTVRVDRTYVDHAGVRWIVDYKTSSHGGGDLERFLANECERYREMMRRYRDLWSLHDPRPVRTALYFPLHAAWREIE